MKTNKEQFEEFAESMGWKGKLHMRDENNYDDWAVNPMWKAWQASRQALAVQLPTFEDYPASMEREMQQSLLEVLTVAGVKAK